MLDVNHLQRILQNVQQNPQVIDMLAGQLAANPNMAPPPPGSMAQAMSSLVPGPDVTQGAPGTQLQGGTQVQPPAQGPAPLAEQMSLGQLLQGSQNPLPPGALTQPTTPQGMDPAAAARAFGALEPPPEQRQMQPAYIGNLAFGAATPARGINMPYSPVAPMGSLSDYLRRR